MLIKIVLLFFFCLSLSFSLTLCGSRTLGCNGASVVGIIALSRRLMSSCAGEPTSSIGVFLYSSSPK